MPFGVGRELAMCGNLEALASLPVLVLDLDLELAVHEFTRIDGGAGLRFEPAGPVEFDQLSPRHRPAAWTAPIDDEVLGDPVPSWWCAGDLEDHSHHRVAALAPGEAGLRDHPFVEAGLWQLACQIGGLEPCNQLSHVLFLHVRWRNCAGTGKLERCKNPGNKWGLADRAMDIGVWMNPDTLEEKLEASEEKNPEQAWNMGRWPTALSEPGPHRLFVASRGAWIGYFMLAGEALYNPDDTRTPFTILFDTRTWTQITPVPVQRFRGFTYKVPDIAQATTGKPTSAPHPPPAP